MHIQKVNIKNFRLLEEVELILEERTTVIVGRNNSGKTSLTELFRRLLSEKTSAFNLEDFSLGAHEQFWTAYGLKAKKTDEAEIRKVLPVIEVKLRLAYNKDASNLGLLSNFIVDLNPDCSETLIEICCQLEDGKIEAFFEGIDFAAENSESEKKTAFFRVIKERVPKYYKPSLFAVDPNDPTNRKIVDWPTLRALLQTGFINAQRGLDDTTHKDNDVLGKILEALFKTAMSASADAKDRSTVQGLEVAVQNMQSGIDKNFTNQLTSLLPTFNIFGYPGLPDPKLRTETSLDVERLLKDHTKIRYLGVNGVHLPESYNGLGARNLIFILLKLLEYFKSFQAIQPSPSVHLIFIEEPEAHLHPQMQEVFITKLNEIANIFAKAFNDGKPWPVQFVVTTHSSHLANKASFKSIRYFLTTAKNNVDSFYITKIKDLGKGFSGVLKDDEAFLHQYMTLTRCDLLFADKAILIEGTSERLLLPKMIDKVDDVQPKEAPRLASQYVSVIEVGGAYAHKFFLLLDFLELRTLIITDLDSTNANDTGKACKVSEGTGTSNACIKTWFGDPHITPTTLVAKTNAEKIKGIRYLSYQMPEEDGGPCGRSFEDAFILANLNLFNLTRSVSKTNEQEAWEMAKEEKKSAFALKYAIEDTTWAVPRYIKEGLVWLANKATPVVIN